MLVVIEVGVIWVVASQRRTFAGAPVARVEVAVPQQAPEVRDRLHARGIPTFEADVRFAVRFLIDRGIKGGCRIRGEARPGPGVDWVFDEPDLAPAEVRVLSEGRFRVQFEGPQHGVAPGQAVVLYDGDRVLGGGWIC